jgi:hypothetical protein
MLRQVVANEEYRVKKLGRFELTGSPGSCKSDVILLIPRRGRI